MWLMILPKSIIDELSRQKHEGWGKARRSQDGRLRVKER